MLSEGSIVAICTCAVTIATLYFQNKKNAESSKARAEDLKVAVDGKISTLIQKVEAEGVLKVQVASLEATAAGKEQGEAKATLAAMQDQLAARALPPLDPKATAPGGQSDRIEKTGEDTNVRVQKVETTSDRRVSDVEAKIDAKDKA